MPDVEKSGLKAAVAQAIDEAGGSDALQGTAEQLQLLPIRQVVPDETAANEGDNAPRGVGRPAGSRNKNTEAWRDYILGRYQSPLVAMAETYSRSVKALAKEFGRENPTYDDLVELFKLQLQCAKELAPYVHSKQPQALDVGDNGLMTLIINSGQATKEQVDDAGGMKINFLDNQDVIDAEELNSVACDSVASDTMRDNTVQSGCDVTDCVSVGTGGKE